MSMLSLDPSEAFTLHETYCPSCTSFSQHWTERVAEEGEINGVEEHVEMCSDCIRDLEEATE